MEFRGPITALCPVKDTLLFGEGPNVKIHHAGHITHFCSLDTHEAVRIILSVQDHYLFVAGKRLFVANHLPDDPFNIIQVSPVDLLLDWILDVKAFDDKIYVLSAHGRLSIMSISKLTLLRSVLIEGYGLFYSGLILSADTILLGTIFSGVWVYSVSNDKLHLKRKLESLHRGSIFDIQANSKYIFSCSDDRCIAVWRRADYSSVALLKGHDARVWRLACTENHLVSGSEDASVRVWELAKFTCRALFKDGHWGRSVWSVAVASDSIVFSGGADGGIRQWSIECLASLVVSSNVKAFHTCGADTFTLSADGSVYKNDKLYYTSLYLSKYAIFASSDALLVIGDLYGRLHCIDRHGGNATILPSLQAKLTRINILSSSLLLVQDAHRIVRLLKIDDCLSLLRTCRNSFDDRVITSVYYNDDSMLFVGLRDGSLVLCDLNLSIIRNLVVGMDAVTAIHRLSEEYSIICDRSGHIKLLNLPNFTLLAIGHVSSVSLEGIIASPDKHVYLYGFHERCFTVMNAFTKDIYWQVDCGGGHRLWQFSSSSNGFSFTFLRSGILQSVNCEYPMNVLQSPLHGLEIRCLLSFNAEYMVSGGEDCCLLLLGSASLIPRQRIVLPVAIKSMCRLDADRIAVGGAQETLVVLTFIRELNIFALTSCTSSTSDVRVMTIACTDHLIVTGCSDGTVAIHSWQHEELVISRKTKLPNCVLCVSHLDDQVFAATSSGSLYRLSSMDLSIVSCLKVHQSSITAMIFHNEHLFTGGDDGRVARTDVLLSNTVSVPAHNGTINGLVSGPSMVVSSAVDQSIAYWDTSSDPLAFITLRRRHIIPLTDCSCLLGINHATHSALIAGGRGLFKQYLY